MVVATLAIQGLLQILIATSFLYVAQTVRGRARATSADSRLALWAFLAWWLGFAGYILHLAIYGLLAAVGLASFPVFFALRILAIPLLSAALWGMVTYVLLVYTGRSSLTRVVAVYAIGLALLFYAEAFLATDGTLEFGAWTATIHTTNALLTNGIYVYFAIPLLVSIAAYGFLVRRVSGAEPRYRVLLVFMSMFTWVVSGLVGELSGNGLAAFVSVSAFGIIASGAIVAAYRPPPRVRAWLEARDAARGIEWAQTLSARANAPGWESRGGR